MAQWVSAAAAVIGLIVAGFAAHLHSRGITLQEKLRADLAEFRNDLIDDMDQRYLRKPEFAEDYPVSRREFATALKQKSAPNGNA